MRESTTRCLNLQEKSALIADARSQGEYRRGRESPESGSV